MSTADARDELEAALWRLSGATRTTAPALVDYSLGAAAAYAEAVADERVAGHVHERDLGRERLAEAAAEVSAAGARRRGGRAA